MANPSTFEDEKEFRNFKRYDLMSDQEVFDKYLSFSKQYNLNFTEVQHIEHATERSRNPPFRNPETMRMHNERVYKEYTDKVGVLSLTAYNNKLDMWNYYASKGSGICVGLDTKILFDYIGGGGEIHYPPDGLPVIKGTDSFEIERIIQTLFKDPKWKFENEYRTSIFSPFGLTDAERKIQLPLESFKEVIVGWDMHLKEVKRIIQLCRQMNLQVAFKRAYRGGDPVEIKPLQTV